MQEHFFILAIAGIWLVFASIQDIKKTEVANWVSFSLIGMGLAYKGIYYGSSGDLNYVLFGMGGFLIFTGLAHAFYYSRAFGGADAKLMMAMGAVLPFSDWKSLGWLSIEFIFLLFFVGTIYSLIYSFFISARNWGEFKKGITEKVRKYKLIWASAVILGIFIIILMRNIEGAILSGGIIFVTILFVYLKAFEERCMTIRKKPGDLMEGDWLEEEVKAGNNLIKKSVHGLSAQDIKLLKRCRKSVIVKQGIPFVPAFLISFLFMVFSSTFLQSLLEKSFSLFL